MSSAFDQISAVASSQPKSKKSTTPMVQLPELATHCEQFRKAKQARDAADSQMAMARDHIVTVALPVLTRECRELGAVQSSIKINGMVTMTRTRRYSDIPQDAVGGLMEAFGEQGSRFFKQSLEITLGEASSRDETVLQKLLDVFGDEFPTHFNVRRKMTVSEEFHHALIMDPDVEQTAAPFLDDETIRPYSPSIKV